MYVIYHSSDSFAGVTGVSMLSLFENNKEFDEIHVLYIERGMSEENRCKLRSIAETYGRQLEFMEMPNWSERLGITLKSCKSGWLGFGYNRLFLTEFIPQNVNKVLYLDSDTVIEGSLNELWNIDISDYYLAGVDDCLSSKYRKVVGLDNCGTYVNAGMLMINLKRWREENVISDFIKLLRDNNGYFIFNEQSIINSLFSGKIRILPQKYNVNTLVYLFTYDELLKLRKPHKFSYSVDEYNEARKSPVITHYTGNFLVNRRPWIHNSDHPHSTVYDKYKNISPWSETEYLTDNRKKSEQVYNWICNILPRRCMIWIVSILYNYIRPIQFKRKINENRL